MLIIGNKGKCRSLLQKGKDFGAQPLELLRRAFDNLIEGKKDLLEKHKSSESSVDSSPFSTGILLISFSFLYTFFLLDHYHHTICI